MSPVAFGVTASGSPMGKKSRMRIKPEDFAEGQVVCGTPVARGLAMSMESEDCAVNESLPCPAYMHSEIIEYFSCTNRIWTVGLLTCTGGAGTPLLLNVSVNRRSQVRVDVALDCLRSRLRSGELVEVFVDSDGGGFLPAVVTPDQPRAATMTGYHVEVQSSGEVLMNVASLRLRRRFPASSLVEVYRGQKLGWCEARIHAEAASLDGCGAEVLPLPGIAADSVLKVSQSELAFPGNNGVSLHPLPALPNRDDIAPDVVSTPIITADIGIWTQVPLWTVEGPPEWVPSYIVRANIPANSALMIADHTGWLNDRGETEV